MPARQGCAFVVDVSPSDSSGQRTLPAALWSYGVLFRCCKRHCVGVQVEVELSKHSCCVQVQPHPDTRFSDELVIYLKRTTDNVRCLACSNRRFNPDNPEYE
jgi:hypothetical protein